MRRAEERRIADAKREEAAAAREAVHREEARRAKQKHDAELEKIAEQKRLNDAEAQEALEAREALRQSSLRKNRAKAKASAATAESTAVMTSVRLKFCGAFQTPSTLYLIQSLICAQVKATKAAEEAERIAKQAEAKALEIRKQEEIRKASLPAVSCCINRLVEILSQRIGNPRRRDLTICQKIVKITPPLARVKV